MTKYGFKEMVEESDGPEDLTETRGKALFGDEISLNAISEKLIEAANVITDHRIAIALGKEVNSNSIFYNSSESEWILKQVEPMIRALEQTKKIHVQHMKDVTQLVGKGKLSLTEAKSYMELVTKQTTMDLLNELD